ncbi:hypothetical protein CIB48_g9272 [Xylaria polymorpha]|nr:hypothetical protein CIB48_g9272 [Xylaria polymorpha]
MKFFATVVAALASLALADPVANDVVDVADVEPTFVESVGTLTRFPPPPPPTRRQRDNLHYHGHHSAAWQANRHPQALPHRHAHDAPQRLLSYPLPDPRLHL